MYIMDSVQDLTMWTYSDSGCATLVLLRCVGLRDVRAIGVVPWSGKQKRAFGSKSSGGEQHPQHAPPGAGVGAVSFWLHGRVGA